MEKYGQGFLDMSSWLGRLLLDHFYPPVCIHCQAALGAPDALCAPCWRRLRPITQPLCPHLGLPFEVSIGPGALSAEAIANPAEFDRARCALVHNEVARSIVSRLKFGDRPELAKFCAGMMLVAGAELLDKESVLVPVPLHRARQFQRRYNQSCELARAMSRAGGILVELGAVRRKRSTRPQIGLNARQREQNVAGAFECSPDVLERIGGRPVIIVDDVMTTGSTLRAVTRALKAKGVGQIDVITFSRVVIGAGDGL